MADQALTDASFFANVLSRRVCNAVCGARSRPEWRGGPASGLTCPRVVVETAPAAILGGHGDIMAKPTPRWLLAKEGQDKTAQSRRSESPPGCARDEF